MGTSGCERLMNAITELVGDRGEPFSRNVGHVLGSRNLRSHDPWPAA